MKNLLLLPLLVWLGETTILKNQFQEGGPIPQEIANSFISGMNLTTRQTGVCSQTTECGGLKGTCKQLQQCYLERGTRYYCCDGEHVSTNLNNCECCVPDGCKQFTQATPECVQKGGECRKYCLPGVEIQLKSSTTMEPITCSGESCPCCTSKKCKKKDQCLKSKCRKMCEPGEYVIPLADLEDCVMQDCICCKKCKSNNKCKKANGVCQSKSKVCRGKIIKKGCKSKFCKCCVPESEE